MQTDITVYGELVEVVIVDPGIITINNQEYITYQWQGAEIAIIQNPSTYGLKVESLA